jgi:hypothetical protein
LKNTLLPPQSGQSAAYPAGAQKIDGFHVRMFQGVCGAVTMVP